MSRADETPTLRLNRRPECGARRFVSKLLVYEIMGDDEGGEQEFRRQHVREEFEYTCSECRTPPADRRDYYDEAAVLETERQSALRDQLRQLGRWFWRRLAARTTWLTLRRIRRLPIGEFIGWVETRHYPLTGMSSSM